jgi:HEAT repeat protein
MRKLIVAFILSLLGGLLLPASGTAQTFLRKDAGAWEKTLNESKVADQRRNAAFALGKLGSTAAFALPSLKKHLKEDEPKVREAAAFAIGDIGKESLKSLDDPTLIDALAAALKDSDALVRRSAAYALGNFGPGAKSAQATLEAVLAGDPSPAVRQNIAWALGKIGPETIDSLKAALRDADPAVKRDAAKSIGLFKEEVAKKALPELIACCEVNNSSVRSAALNVLYNILDESNAAAAPSIAKALDDPDVEVKLNAALVLSNVGGKQALRAIPILMDALKQKSNKGLRSSAAVAIYNIGEEAYETVPTLIQVLSDDDLDLHSDVALALGGIGRKAEAAVPALVKVVANPKEKDKARVEAAKALGKIGPVPAAVEAVPTLVRVLADPGTETKIRERVIWALRPHYANRPTIPDLPGVFDAFIKILSEPKTEQSRMLHYDCAYMLGVLQKDKAPEKVLDTLKDFLHDKTIFIYRGAQGSTGTTGSEVQKGEANVKEEGKGDGRVMAIQALLRVGYSRVGKRADIMKQLRVIAADPETLPDMFVKTIAAFRAFGADSGVAQATVTKRLRAIIADKNTDPPVKAEAEKLLQ